MDEPNGSEPTEKRPRDDVDGRRTRRDNDRRGDRSELGTRIAGKQKAIAAYVATLLLATVTALATALTALPPGATLADLDTLAVLTICAAVLGSTGLTGALVYRVPNVLRLQHDDEPDTRSR